MKILVQATGVVTSRVELLQSTDLFDIQEALLISSVCDMANRYPKKQHRSLLSDYDPYFFQTRFENRMLRDEHLIGPLSAWLAFEEFDFRTEILFAVVYEHGLPRTDNEKAKVLHTAYWLLEHKIPSPLHDHVSLLFTQKKFNQAYSLILSSRNT